MAGLTSFSFVMLVVELLVFVCGSNDPTVDILKDKMIALESSLDQDIKLLRVEISQLSDELSQITSLLKNTLDDRKDIQPEHVKTPEIKEHAYDLKNDLEEFKNRIKRSIAMEKAHSRALMNELKTEISKFGKEMARSLTEIRETQTKSQIELSEFKNDTLETLVEFKNDTLETLVEFKKDTLETLVEFKNDTLETLVEFKNDTLETLVEFKNDTLETLVEFKNDTLETLVEFKNDTLETLVEFKAETLDTLVEFKNDTLETLVEFKNDTLETLVEFKTETLETLVEFKTESLKQVNEGQTRVQLGLTEYLNKTLIHEIDAMSDDITMVTNECVSGLETLSTTNEKQSSTIDSSMKALSLKITGLEVKANNIESKVKYIACGDHTYTVGKTRLANVTQDCSTIGGRLEVLYKGRWGTVCNDGFDWPETKVACRALGLRAHSYQTEAYFGQGSEPIWMDDVDCSGQESSLFDCPRLKGLGLMLGEHNCGHHEDVGVICLK